MRKFLLFLCLLAPSIVHGEEIKISLDMSYEKAIELLQKCGAEDITARKQLPASSANLYWWMSSYDLQVTIGQHYGKVNHLGYWSRRESDVGGLTGVDRGRNEDAEHQVQNLTFDTEKKMFSYEYLAAVQNPSAIPERWNVRVEMLVVDMPQEKALAMLPDLRDDAKIEGAYAQIIEAIQRKEATLVGYPFVYTLNGQRATSETIQEKLYPTQFQPPEISQNFGNSNTVTTTTTTTKTTDDAQKGMADAVPTNFEKRNVGVTLEVNPEVRDGGKSIYLDLEPQHVALEGFDTYEASKVSGVTIKVAQPQFYTTKQSSSLLIRNGQRLLYGMHQLHQSGQVELFILQGSATLIQKQ